MSEKFVAEISKRRTIYALGKTLPKPKAEVSKVIKDAIRICPSAFNVQSSRAIILYGSHHEKLWSIVKGALRAVVKDDEAYKASEEKVNGCFAAGAGTVLFFEDKSAIEAQQKQFPTYANSFPVFSQHSSAMAQFAVWSALAQDGIGASLQHYNELIVGLVAKEFNVPENWELIAQMPFGSIERPAEVRSFIADKDRFLTLGE